MRGNPQLWKLNSVNPEKKFQLFVEKWDWNISLTPDWGCVTMSEEMG